MQNKLSEYFQSVLLNSTGADSFYELEVIQSLWSGYGKIVRYGLEGCDLERVVVKHVRFPHQQNHPRGWNTDLGHERKLKSYQVEMAWYSFWADQCDELCRVPKCYALETEGDEVLMVMEDLDASGFPERLGSLNWDGIELVLRWLAHFHATFMSEGPESRKEPLWKIGTYWHLDTRPEEWKIMTDGPLKEAADKVDAKLNQAKYLSLVHGDAKLANFCFSSDQKAVSAVDFQYVGGGCGMKDVAYFIGSCLYEDDCERLESKILNSYFGYLKEAMQKRHPEMDFAELEQEWRELYHVAWADFHRFLKGWSPDHWKINSYSERVSREVVANLNV